MFHTWAAELPPEVEVCGIQLPGRESRFMEPPFTRMPPLVDTLSHALLPYLDTPFAFFGHSMGALVGFELARHIRRHHRIEPLHLFVSGCRAPHMPNPEPPLHPLPDYALIHELRRFGGIPEEALQNGELMSLLLPTLRADLALYETYMYSVEEPFRCSISAFGGLQDVKVDYNYLAAWWAQTYGSFTLRMFDGGHFFLLNARKPLLQAISQDLAQLISWWG
jgi:medium-chain acyl-[acyl-carrier-protein] hydrolase